MIGVPPEWLRLLERNAWSFPELEGQSNDKALHSCRAVSGRALYIRGIVIPSCFMYFPPRSA